MKFSCIIPTCGRNSYLIEAIDSVLVQTVLPDEIIVVNNGRQELSLFPSVLEKINIIKAEPFIGASRARNLGAKSASGDFLAFLDDDDLWNPKYLENVQVALREGAQCIFSRLDILRDGSIRVLKNPHGKINIKTLLTINPGTGGPNLVISRDLFFKVGGFDENLVTSEDKSLAIEVLKTGVAVVALPENQVIVRQDPKIFRLSDAETLARGIRAFTKKYSKMMNGRQYLFNWQKIFFYRYKSGKKYWAIPYFLLRFFAGLRIIIKKANQSFSGEI